MSKTKFGLNIFPATSYLSVVAAGVMTAGSVFAAETQALVSGLTETLEPAKAMQPTDEQVKQVMTARKGFGFRSDEKYVRNLLTRPESFGALVGFMTGGHYATPNEVEELKIRLAVQEDALTILPVANEDRDFAGLYVDGKGYLNIGFTVNADKKVEVLRRKAEIPQRIQAFTAERSMVELENSKQRVIKSNPELLAEGIQVSQVAIDIANNNVKVGVADLDPAKRELIVLQFGQVEVFEKAINEVELRSDTADPMRAGVRITNVSGGSCTSNWKARDRDTNDLVMITAGHCGPDVDGTLGGPGVSMFQGVNDDFSTRKIGVSDQTTWTFPTVNPGTGARTGSSPVDAMRVPFLDNIGSLPWLYAYNNGNAGVFSDGEKAPVGDADGTVVVGTSVCSGGQFSPADQVGGSNWKNCGTVSAVNVANGFFRQPGSPDVFTVLNTNVADYVAIPGDSGAPVWRLSYDSSDGWEVIAVGHHSGGPTGSEIFNDVNLVEDELNVDIVHF